ncbi:MAG: 3-hydroxyacyl-CoA dehydrogenase NAD-binding domain-containing protein [Actinomycetota bacterium]
MTSEIRRAAVVGCGLMGTSIAMAAARAGATVRGFDLDPRVLALAATRSGLEPAPGAAEAVAAALRG